MQNTDLVQSHCTAGSAAVRAGSAQYYTSEVVLGLSSLGAEQPEHMQGQVTGPQVWQTTATSSLCRHAICSIRSLPSPGAESGVLLY